MLVALEASLQPSQQGPWPCWPLCSTLGSMSASPALLLGSPERPGLYTRLILQVSYSEAGRAK